MCLVNVKKGSEQGTMVLDPYITKKIFSTLIVLELSTPL
jgi:hypothetical protein